MADDEKDRRDEGKEPKVARVGQAPRAAANGNVEQTGERAAKDAIHSEVDDYGKS